MLNRKFYFFSGKGGVGKTTISSALAVALSERRLRTLLVSLDPAHSLSLALDVEVGGKVKKVSENLFAVEIDVESEMKSYLHRVKKEAEKVVSPVILEEIKDQIDLAYYSPGAFELAILDVIHRIISESEKSYDRIVFDTAPSGYTLRLVSLPSLLNRWLHRLIDLRKEALKLHFYSDLEDKRKLEEVYSQDTVLSVLVKRKEQIETLRGVLLNRGKTLFGIVVSPDVLPIQIAKKTVDELEASGIEVELVVFNRFRGEVEKVRKAFSGKRIIFVREKEKEPIGIERLRLLGEELLSQLT
ncbi:ArsA family ATPase [Desulfurobacterium crinifex]